MRFSPHSAFPDFDCKSRPPRSMYDRFISQRNRSFTVQCRIKSVESQGSGWSLWSVAQVLCRTSPRFRKTLIQTMRVFHFVRSCRFISFHTSAAKKKKKEKGSEAHRCPSCAPPCIIRHLLIHNIGCYHSRVHQVKFKRGQVRIRQRPEPGPIINVT